MRFEAFNQRLSIHLIWSIYNFRKLWLIQEANQYWINSKRTDRHRNRIETIWYANVFKRLILSIFNSFSTGLSVSLEYSIIIRILTLRIEKVEALSQIELNHFWIFHFTSWFKIDGFSFRSIFGDTESVWIIPPIFRWVKSSPHDLKWFKIVHKTNYR